MSLLDYHLRSGLAVGLQAGGALIGVLAVVALAALAVYLVFLGGMLLRLAYLDRERRRLARLEPGVDRPYGIDAAGSTEWRQP